MGYNIHCGVNMNKIKLRKDNRIKEISLKEKVECPKCGNKIYFVVDCDNNILCDMCLLKLNKKIKLN